MPETTKAPVDLFSAQSDPKVSSKKAEAAADDEAELARVAAETLRTMVRPGQVSEAEAARYWSQIVALFGTGEGLATRLPMFAWGALNAVGSRTDYSTAPDIEIGGRRVRATKVFGEIMPVDNRGIPRKVYSTLFEQKAAEYVKALGPDFAAALAPRAAKSGHVGANPVDLIDFCRGVTPGTSGSAGVRVSVKDNLIGRRGNGQPVGEAPVSMPQPTSASSGGLFG